jgi:hypothetical protein
MAEGARAAIGATGPTEESGAIPLAIEGASGRTRDAARSFLAAARRDLTEEQASSPAGVRWLMHDVERLDQERTALRTEFADIREKYEALREDFNDKRVELEATKSAARVSARNEALTYLCVSAGSAGLGACPGYFSVSGATTLATTGIVISALLLMCGLTLRVWK